MEHFGSEDPSQLPPPAFGKLKNRMGKADAHKIEAAAIEAQKLKELQEADAAAKLSEENKADELAKSNDAAKKKKK